MIHCSAQRESHWDVIAHAYRKSHALSRFAVAKMLLGAGPENVADQVFGGLVRNSTSSPTCQPKGSDVPAIAPLPSGECQSSPLVMAKRSLATCMASAHASSSAPAEIGCARWTCVYEGI